MKASTGRNALVRKELADHLKSKRFLILLLLIGCTSFASLYGAISGLSDAIQLGQQLHFPEALHLKRKLDSVVHVLYCTAWTDRRSGTWI